MRKILLWIWQFPQNLLGILFWAFFYRPWDGVPYISGFEPVTGRMYWSYWMKGDVTLGEYVFIHATSPLHAVRRKTTLMHESGHVRQSRMLGPLYLVVIGLPSLLWAWSHKVIAPKRAYYWFYTEKWANRLGGVE